MEAAEGVEEAARPDGGFEESAVCGVIETAKAVELDGGEAPVVVEADEVLGTDGLFGAEFGGEFSGDAEIPPVGVGDEGGGSPEAPCPVEPTGFGFEEVEAVAGVDGNDFDG